MKRMTNVVLSVMMFCVTPLYSGLAWSGPVNINSADALTLAKELTGIGEKKAQAIVRYRDQNGPFTNIEALTNVKGISAKIIEKNKADLNL
ncbi:hypothetical protein MNBD_GAMMA07-1168 [hydrothermal vent metagenome]|uniref:Helix-hairpin-helix DNA-binding motif class 1 domain-containing protein n=1 Tax=hydrothermal vent metagenome TaxID=652676 RepID=A0A3B0WLU9_9ZZZZ